MRVEGRDGEELNEGSKAPSQLRLGMESTFGATEHSQANQLAMPLMRSAALLFRSTTRPRHLGWGPEAASVVDISRRAVRHKAA